MATDTMTLRELTIRYTAKTTLDGAPVAIGRTVLTPGGAAAIFMTVLADQPIEVFAMLCLSTKRRVLAYHEVARGTLDTVLVHPRDVFKAALLANAAAIIIAHNHPSGDPTPSPDDIALTRRLVEAGALMGIDVLDHVVVGDGGYISLHAQGRLSTAA